MTKTIMTILLAAGLPVLAIMLGSCTEDSAVEYDPTPYALAVGNFPDAPIPPDNKLTNAGVELGRMLFYEKLLSGDGSQACADCHVQADAFTDLDRFSLGIQNLEGRRQAMVIFNMAWHDEGFSWDGRAQRLRDQALMPIQDPLEMDETLENVISKLSEVEDYRDQFVRAFGSEEINEINISLALEQFMNSIISKDSKWDRFLAGTETLTESEERGRSLFFNEFDPFGLVRGAECFHCHGGFNFTNNALMNNGLDSDLEFTDLGLFEVTGLDEDKAKFKVPSLRNIALTPPYMHDGRFATLEEVIDHYDLGVEESSTVDPLMQYNLEPGLGLTTQEKADLIAFMKTLTDDLFLNNPEYSSPF